MLFILLVDFVQMLQIDYYWFNKSDNFLVVVNEMLSFLSIGRTISDINVVAGSETF